ncbi:MAG: endonuclease Q family protein [bacterium]|nr:endonuclease Q family protein [bacterium]
MKVVADLHLHSKYSRAVSPQMVLPEMAKWAKRKGIDLLGTGDFTHPLWFRELKSQLEQSGEGIYKLKMKPFDSAQGGKEPLFLCTTEISSIYSQGGRGRRIHTVIFAPSLETVEKINQELLRRGANLMADGRPIIGLSARDLAELVLGVDQNCLVIPAHVWTPWFSLYGSESGFDSIEECFGNMAKNIFAIETGLSSDPAMNWRISDIDNRQILSFSDAHSGPKLGRETTVFEVEDTTKLRYADIRNAIRRQENQASTAPNIVYTTEFYPEEGKYHYTGHRNCQIKQSPEETRRLGETCPACGRHLTVGVMHRVEKLASRNIKCQMTNDKSGTKWVKNEESPARPPYAMLVPLLEIIAESMRSTPSSQRVINEYNNLTDSFNSEFAVLLETPAPEIAKISGEKVAEGISRVREGKIVVDPGYDGVFGVVKIWGDHGVSADESEQKKDQLSLF